MTGRTFGAIVAAVLAAGVATGAAGADAAEQPVGRAAISYSAELRIQTGGAVARLMTGRVFHTKDAERREHRHQGTRSIVIIRWDQKRGWLLNPAKKTFAEVPLARAVRFRGLPPPAASTRMRVGRATINGIPTTKYKVSAIRRDGKPFRGFMWVSDDNIVMKIASALGFGQPYALELDNVRRGPQDQALFAPPKGWRQVTLPKARAKSGGRRRAKSGDPRRGKSGGRRRGKSGGPRRSITEADIRLVERQMRARGATEKQIQKFRRLLERQMKRGR